MPAVDNFFDAQSEASGVKARIITKYFDTWARIVLPSTVFLGEKKIAYIDLYCGPGRYADDKKSTPLLVLEKAINNPNLAKHLVTIFNDSDDEAVRKLADEIKNLPGVKTLTNEPILMNEEVGAATAQYFQEKSIVPSFTFIDPFGYVGLSRDLIAGVTKNWGCDCIFFFNYDRINRALSAPPLFTERMEAIFGSDRAVELERKMQQIKGSTKNNPEDREEVIVDTLTGALEELNKGDNYVRSFRFKKGKRTSHMLVFVTKHPLGYRVMNEIMAKEGHVDRLGIPSYTHYDNPPGAVLFSPAFDELKQMLCDEYAGKTITMQNIYEEHSLRRNYIESNYKDVLRELESEGRIHAYPPASARRMLKGKRTFGGNTKVTFLPRKK